MANEITITGGLAFKKGSEQSQMTGNHQADMAGVHYVQRVDDISTVEEAIGKGDIATLGYCFFKNVGSGTIRIGGVTGVYSLSLAEGKSGGPTKWATNAIFAICDDTGGKLEMLLLEL